MSAWLAIEMQPTCLSLLYSNIWIWKPIHPNLCTIDRDVITTWKFTGFGRSMHRVVWERLLALSGTSYKWFSQHGVHPSSGLIIHFQKKTSFAQDSQISYWLQPVCPRSPLLPYGFTSVT